MLCWAGSVLVDTEQLASRLKLGLRRVVAMGLTSPHQMDPLCLSTRRHWVHWVSGSLLGIPYQGGVFCLFVFVRFFLFCFVFPRTGQPLTSLDAGTSADCFYCQFVSRAHPTPARPTQLRIAPYIMMSSLDGELCCSFSHLFFFSSCVSVIINLPFVSDFVPLCSLWKKHHRSLFFFLNLCLFTVD